MGRDTDITRDDRTNTPSAPAPEPPPPAPEPDEPQYVDDDPDAEYSGVWSTND